MRLHKLMVRAVANGIRLIVLAVGFTLLTSASFHAMAQDGGIGASAGIGGDGIGASVGIGGIGASASIGGDGVGASAGIGGSGGGIGASADAGIGGGSAGIDASASLGGTQGAASIGIGSGSVSVNGGLGTVGGTQGAASISIDSGNVGAGLSLGIGTGVSSQTANDIGSLASIGSNALGSTLGSLSGSELAKLRKTCRQILAAPARYSANARKVCKVVASL